jgi:hypothetical protein
MPRLTTVTITSATPRIKGVSDYVIAEFPLIYREVRRMKLKHEDFLHMHISARYTQGSKNVAPTMSLICIDSHKRMTRTIPSDDAGEQGSINQILDGLCRKPEFELHELDQIEVTFTRDRPSHKRART